jgi:hypothetical protein
MMFPSIVTVPLQLDWFVAVAIMPLLLIFTSSNILHEPWVTVHLKVFTPELKLLTVLFFKVELAMIPVPIVRVHTPVPWLGGTLVGSTAANVAVVIQMF